MLFMVQYPMKLSLSSSMTDAVYQTDCHGPQRMNPNDFGIWLNS